jgi:hypothetical protein
VTGQTHEHQGVDREGDAHHDQRHVGVEVVGDQHDREPQQGRQRPEVHVGVAVVDEALDAEGARGHVEVPVPEGIGLELEEVGAERRVQRSAPEVRPEVQQDGVERRSADDEPSDAGDADPAALEVRLAQAGTSR